MSNPIPVTLIVTPSKPGEPAPEIRLRQWLKLGLRGFGVKVSWMDATTVPTAYNNCQIRGGASESLARRSTALDATGSRGPEAAPIKAPATRAKSTRTHRSARLILPDLAKFQMPQNQQDVTT